MKMILTKIINWFKPTTVESIFMKTNDVKLDNEVVVLELKSNYKIVKNNGLFALQIGEQYVDLKYNGYMTWNKTDLFCRDCRTPNIRNIRKVIERLKLDILIEN